MGGVLQRVVEPCLPNQNNALQNVHLQQEWPQQWQFPVAFHDNVYMVQENETPYRVPIREEEQLEHAVNVPQQQPQQPPHHENAHDGASDQVAIRGEEQPERVSSLKDRDGKFSTTYPPGLKLQPAGTFSYLLEDYTKPNLPISGNSLADNTAATVKEFFTTEVLERRRTVDSHLKAFKQSLGKGTNDPLPACFVAWKNEIFPEQGRMPKEGSFHFKTCISNDQASLLQSIRANKPQDSLTPELITTGTHMNNLLATCLEFLRQKDDLKCKIKEDNMQLYMLYIEVRTRTTDMIIKELKSLPTEIDRFADEIHILMKNIQVALDSYGMKKRKRSGAYIHASRKIQQIIPEIDKSQMQKSNAGYLREVDVIAETSVLVTNQSQTFYWEGYGLKLHIPQGALPAGLEECTLLIKVGLSGSFEFPQNTSLVSAVYWLDSKPRCKFSKSLTVTIQHCVKPAHTSRLSFVHARCSQTHLPYQFETVEEGVFSSEKGCLQLNHFSLLAVVLSVVSRVHQLLPPGAQLYKASLYYLRKAATQRDIHFVITMDLEAHTTHVHKEYTNKGATIGADLHIGFESSMISLQLPSDGVLKDGWRIIPLFDPRITKEEVDSFKPRQRIPSCQLTAGWTKESKPSRLIYKVTLEGVRVPSNYFHIVLDGVPPDPLDSEPELLGLMNEVAAKIPSKWRDVGLQLGLDQGVLDGIALNSPGDTNHCYSNVFTRWKNQNLITHPYTWSTIVQALRAPAVGEERLADDIKNKWTWQLSQ